MGLSDVVNSVGGFMGSQEYNKVTQEVVLQRVELL